MAELLEPEKFLDAVTVSTVLSPELERNLRAWSKAMNADTTTIAKYILDQGWMTPYQLQRIHAGKGHKLAVGSYHLLDILGEGSMGRVFKARHSRMGRIVALKVIRKDLLANPRAVLRFQQEVRAVGQLAHPNIVLAIDADNLGAQHYVAMELIEGEGLKELVRRHGPMPMHVACEYIRQAALGLQHASENKLVHRDIKPSNLMVTKSGVIKVLDFGLAMLHDPESEDLENRVTAVGTVLGTPDFLAPEQAQNSRDVDSRADIYALGGSLFYLLTGRIPFEARTPAAKIMRHMNDPPPSLRAHRPELPVELERLIHRMMAKHPADRPQTPMQVAIELSVFCMMPQTAPASPAKTSSTTFALPESEAPARVRQRVTRFNPWPLRIAALVAVIVAVVIIAIIVQKAKGH